MDAENQPNRRTHDKRVDSIEQKVDRLSVAMFAEDSDNEFKSAGVMTVIKKLDTHIDVVCKIGRMIRYLLVFLVTIVMPGLVSAYQMGWLK